MKDFLLELWTLLRPGVENVLSLLVVAAVVWGMRRLGLSLDVRDNATLQAQLYEATHAAVAHIYQSFVKDLKDPSKPGTFDEDAQARAARRAIELVQESQGPIVRALQANGIDVTSLLRQLVERAVVELEARVSGTLAAPGAFARSAGVPTASASPLIAVTVPSVPPVAPTPTEPIVITPPEPASETKG